MLAALRAGITRVMLPARNRKDLHDVPPEVRSQLQFVWLENVEDAIEGCLRSSPAASRDRELAASQ